MRFEMGITELIVGVLLSLNHHAEYAVNKDFGMVGDGRVRSATIRETRIKYQRTCLRTDSAVGFEVPELESNTDECLVIRSSKIAGILSLSIQKHMLFFDCQAIVQSH